MAERQSDRMSKITNDSLTRILHTHMATVGVKGLDMSFIRLVSYEYLLYSPAYCLVMLQLTETNCQSKNTPEKCDRIRIRELLIT